MAPARLGKVVKCDDQLIWITLNIIDSVVPQFAVKSVKFALGKDIFVPKGYTHKWIITHTITVCGLRPLGLAFSYQTGLGTQSILKCGGPMRLIRPQPLCPHAKTVATLKNHRKARLFL